MQVSRTCEGTEMVNHQGGVVLVGDYVYGLADNGGLKCIDIKSGGVKWSARSVGKGATTYADGNLIVRSEKSPGAVAIVEATPEGYREKGRFTPPDPSGDRTWSHPVVAGEKLYLRDHDTLLCYDLQNQ